jgi:cytochrome c
MRRRTAVLGWLAGLAAAGSLAGCGGLSNHLPSAEGTVGDPARGQQQIVQYGCGSCHVVPGVRGADGQVGPPLTDFGRRSYIAGMLPNNQANLQHWIRDPGSVVPGNAMPDLGVSAVDAQDIAAYLLSLG